MAPEPDIRASRQPGWAARAASAWPIAGARAAAGGLEVVALGRRGRRRAPSASAKAGGVGQRRVVAVGEPGEDRARWPAGRRGWRARSRRAAGRAAPEPRRCRASAQARPARQTGRSAPRREGRRRRRQRRVPEPGEQPQRGGGVGGAAADAARHRQRLGRAGARRRGPAADEARGAQHEVVGAGPEVAGEGAVDGEREVARPARPR